MAKLESGLKQSSAPKAAETETSLATAMSGAKIGARPEVGIRAGKAYEGVLDQGGRIGQAAHVDAVLRDMCPQFFKA